MTTERDTLLLSPNNERLGHFLSRSAPSSPVMGRAATSEISSKNLNTGLTVKDSSLTIPHGPHSNAKVAPASMKGIVDQKNQKFLKKGE